MTSPTSPTDKTPQEQAEIYSALLDQSNDLIHCVSPEGRFIYVNRAWREALGYSDEEIKSLSLMDIIDESLRKRCQGIFAALINGEQLGGKETIFLTRNGEKITVEGRCQTTSKNGQIVSITGIFRDISDRIKTDIALLESEKRFRTLFENSSDIMQIIAVDGRFLHVNSAWLKAFGYSRDEVQALTIFDIISADCQSHCENVFQKVLSSTGVSEIDTTFLAKNGDRVEIEGNATAIFKDGAPIYSQCIFRDVTERRKMEEELLKAHKLESIGVFAGGLAHDFNNLLTAILGNISMARETAPPDISLANRLKTIETATLRAKGLTQQLLTFAKGGAPIKKLSGVGDVIRDSVDFHLRGSNIISKFHLAPDLWAAEVDKDQLNQVFQNLVINAGQAMPNGGCLTISGNNITLYNNHHSGLKPGRYLLLKVSDEGHGISRQDQEKIFDPYFSNRDNGSGLGLAVAYTIMKKHDGLVTVNSTAGKGSTFSLYLPAASIQLEKTDASVHEPHDTGGKILVMDDEKTVREIAGEMLNYLGYTTCLVSDGEQALTLYQEALAEEKPFDAVLMDLTIPGGMGGKETMARLLEIDPQAYGIASSGYANDPIMAHSTDYGFSGVVPKPYKLDELRNSLASLSGL